MAKPQRSRIYSPRRGTGLPASARAATVERVYRDEHGGLPDFTRLDRRPPPWRRWAIAGGLVTLALLAIAAWTSFLIFKPYTASSGGNVVTTIDVPATADVGAEVAYRIRIANDDRIPAAQIALEVTLPEHFATTASDPAPEDAGRLRWTIGALPAQGAATVTIRGRLFGTPGSDARIEALTLYRPANFNAEFQVVTNARTTLAASPLTVTVTGPNESVPGAEESYAIAYANTGTTTTIPTVLTIELPADFALARATPERPRREELRWPIGELAPGATGTVTLTGAFGDRASGESALRATLAIAPEPDALIPQATVAHATRVLGGDVVLIGTVNDQDAALTAPPGAPLRFRVSVRNAGTAELRDLTVRATLDATSIGDRSMLDFNALEDLGNGTVVGAQRSPTIRRGTITWTAREIADLASLPPGEQRLLAFTLPLRAADAIAYPSDATVTFTASVAVAATGTIEKPRSVTSAPVTITIATGS